MKYINSSLLKICIIIADKVSVNFTYIEYTFGWSLFIGQFVRLSVIPSRL